MSDPASLKFARVLAHVVVILLMPIFAILMTYYSFEGLLRRPDGKQPNQKSRCLYFDKCDYAQDVPTCNNDKEACTHCGIYKAVEKGKVWRLKK